MTIFSFSTFSVTLTLAKNTDQVSEKYPLDLTKVSSYLGCGHGCGFLTYKKKVKIIMYMIWISVRNNYIIYLFNHLYYVFIHGYYFISWDIILCLFGLLTKLSQVLSLGNLLDWFCVFFKKGISLLFISTRYLKISVFYLLQC